MTTKETLGFLAFIVLGMAICSSLTIGVRSFLNAPPAPQSLGSSSDNILPENPTATRVFVGSASTLVVATSSGRVFLELSNASGATTTAQTIFCNYGDRTAVINSGFTLFSSTSKTWALDNLYRGAVRCIAPANGALITVTDF